MPPQCTGASGLLGGADASKPCVTAIVVSAVGCAQYVGASDCVASCRHVRLGPASSYGTAWSMCPHVRLMRVHSLDTRQVRHSVAASPAHPVAAERACVLRGPSASAFPANQCVRTAREVPLQRALCVRSACEPHMSSLP